MKNVIENYLNERNSGKLGSNGPVITISREVGCNAVLLGELIANRLNAKEKDVIWKVISKEVIQESAKELQIDPKKVIKVLHQSQKSSFDLILKGFANKYNVSDSKIKETIKDVIFHFASSGNYIIVGGAAHIIAKDVQKSLDVRLIAPLEYRINSIMQHNQLNKDKALEHINRVEKERTAYRDALLKDDPQNEIFDITLNRAVFTDEEIVDIIEYIAKKKKII